MADEISSTPMSLRDVLLRRLTESGLAPEAQEVLRDLLPDAPVRSDGQTRPLYLRSIAAAGWRGIGPAATLDLRPEPGLTVIAGRNGSGKSSIAEAAEMALTGSNYRWQDRTQIWKQGWRNLHDHTDPQVSVELCADGASAPVTVRRRWSGPGLDDCRTEVEGAASAPHEVIDPERMSLYRPFLPYSELGAMISGPLTTLHDALRPRPHLGPGPHRGTRADRSGAVRGGRIHRARPHRGDTVDHRPARAGAARADGRAGRRTPRARRGLVA